MSATGASPRGGSHPCVLTWHVHGSYLYYLAHTPCQFILPVKPGRPEGFGGRSGRFEWPDNVIEVPVEDVPDLDVDVVLTQSRKNYFEDRFAVLSEEQLRLPLIHLEHDPPRESPTDTRHFVDDARALLVHVTHFNALMWDSGGTATRVIEHGVAVPEGLGYQGTLPRAIAVVNNLDRRGRRLGADVFDQVAAELPVDLAGMGSEERGGLGDRSARELFELETRYRCFFHPIRYTSLGLAVLEAMMLGLPVVGLATTELPTVIEHGRSGYLDTSVERLIESTRRLLHDSDEAARLGANARATALERFHISRFAAEWLATFEEIASRPKSTGATVASIQGAVE